MARETTSHFCHFMPKYMHFHCYNPSLPPHPKIHHPSAFLSGGVMKEVGQQRRDAGGNNGNGRSAVEKERTKMRERQRRSITTNIFHSLRKHGGYRLSPRADINEVLRHLAREAGWIVEPDGTTYRSTAAASSHGANNACPLCGGGRKGTVTAPSMPSDSYLGGGGDCSTTSSPRRATEDSAVNNQLSASGPSAGKDALLAIYLCGAVQQNGKGQQLYLLHQNRAVSNQNTPAELPGLDPQSKAF